MKNRKQFTDNLFNNRMQLSHHLRNQLGYLLLSHLESILYNALINQITHQRRDALWDNIK